MRIETFRLRILAYAKKIRSINLLGGKCNRCGEDNIHKLCFHHINSDEKEIEINRAKYHKWSALEEEVKKCELLCHNCHIEHHFGVDSNDLRFKNNKKLFLEYKGISSCQRCGYNKCNESLHFHHKIDKLFTLAKVSVNHRSLSDVGVDIISELDKCDVLCANCHYMSHIDVNFYDVNKNKIESKILNMRENTPKIDRESVYDMYFNKKMRQIDISNYYNCDRGTICKIIKELKKL